MPAQAIKQHARWWGLLCASLLCSAGAVAQSSPPQIFEDDTWEAVCKTAVAQPLPADTARLEAEAGRETRPDCDEQQLYYGFDREPDYHEALLCAYAHRKKPNFNFLAGSGTLAMLYANGFGVPRDYGFAIRFACEIRDAAIVESELRLGRLEALRDGKLPAGTRFDLCDDQVSGATGAYCEDLQQRLADVGRLRRVAALQAKLPAQAQAMLPQLEAAEKIFETARGTGEYTGGGGSGSAGFEALDQGQLREQFVINLHRFAAGDLPPATAADRAHAEEQMKAAEAAAQAAAPLPGGPNENLGARDPDRESLARTQAAWDALFDAWMRFVPIAYPTLSHDVAATELLRLRIHQLKKVVG